MNLVLPHDRARLAGAVRCCRPLAQQDDAANYPNRAIRIIVPFPAGGPSDVLARIIAQKLTEDWKQPVLVDNRVGANTVIGAQRGRDRAGRRLHAADGDRLDADDEPVPLQVAALRSDQRFRADHAGRQDHAAPDRQRRERHQDGRRPARQGRRPSPASSTTAPAPSRRSSAATCSTRRPARRRNSCATTAAPRSRRGCSPTACTT